MFSRIALGLLGVAVALPGTAAAGWITIKNETNQTVIIQETVTVNGSVRRLKPLKLVPGEVVREFHPAAGQKTICVLEPGLLLNRTICQGELKWQEADRGFSVFKAGDKVKVLTAEEAVALAEAANGPTARAQAPADPPSKLGPMEPPVKNEKNPR
jgi:hypothetical protein